MTSRRAISIRVPRSLWRDVRVELLRKGATIQDWLSAEVTTWADRPVPDPATVWMAAAAVSTVLDAALLARVDGAALSRLRTRLRAAGLTLQQWGRWRAMVLAGLAPGEPANLPLLLPKAARRLVEYAKTAGQDPEVAAAAVVAARDLLEDEEVVEELLRRPADYFLLQAIQSGTLHEAARAARTVVELRRSVARATVPVDTGRGGPMGEGEG